MMCRHSLGRIVLIFVVQVALAQAARAAAAPARAKNVIIMIADGAGFNAYNAASYYQYGRLGSQPYDQPEWVKFACCTLSQGSTSSTYGTYSQGHSGSDLDPVSIWDARADSLAKSGSAGAFKGYAYLKQSPTDSAAAATALATGRKTYNGEINSFAESGFSAYPAESYSNYSGYSGNSGYSSSSSSPSESEKTQTIAEIAKSLGKSTGVITTVSWSDATPAGLGSAHSSSRANRSDIANEMLDGAPLDLIMGAGNPEYDSNGAPRQPASEKDYDNVGGSLTWELLKAGRHVRGWQLLQTRAEFESLANVPLTGRILGTFENSGTVQQERQSRDWNQDGLVNDADKEVAPAYGDPFLTNVPTLVTMTRGALNVLGRNRKGFFLMIEGGAVDHAAHANQPGRLIEEQVDFNRSIQAVIDWVNANSNWSETLVIITADHETGLIWGPDSDTVPFQPLVNRGKGKTPGMYFNSRSHTRSVVPVRARGNSAKYFATSVVGTDPIYGDFVDNTSIFQVMKAAFTGTTPPKVERIARHSKSSSTNSNADYTSGAAYGYGSGNSSNSTGTGSGGNGSSGAGSNSTGTGTGTDSTGMDSTDGSNTSSGSSDYGTSSSSGSRSAGRSSGYGSSMGSSSRGSSGSSRRSSSSGRSSYSSGSSYRSGSATTRPSVSNDTQNPSDSE